MKKNLLKMAFIAALSAIASNAGATEGDLKFLGYSNELINEVAQATGISLGERKKIDRRNLDEADAALEQLTELGRTRAISPSFEGRSEEIREEILSYWDRMSPGSGQFLPLSDELKVQLTSSLRQALEQNHYQIIQLDLVDLPEGSKHDTLRAVVRVTRPVVSRNPYKEIQGYLADVKKICTEAATIDGICYLSEMTTFVAENPKNNYYYEKTILTP